MINQMHALEILARSGKSVFTINDLAILWQVPDRRQLVERIKYYLRTSRLTPISKGVYGYGTTINQFEIAQKLVPMSYISLYTAIQYHGLSFQHYDTIFCVSLASKHVVINSQSYQYHRVKPDIFFESLGLISTPTYVIADKERTICDSMYVYPGISFDNLEGIDPDKLAKLASKYNNLRLERDVKKLCSIVNSIKSS